MVKMPKSFDFILLTTLIMKKNDLKLISYFNVILYITTKYYNFLNWLG